MFDPIDTPQDNSQEHVWTAFVDLLSALVAILLMTLLVPKLMAAAQEAERQASQRRHNTFLNAAGLPTSDFRPIQFDQENRALTLGESAFEKDSYHLSSQIAKILHMCQPSIETYLASNPDNQVAVEGHSDALDFRPGAVIHSPVGGIDTNYALSALRAVAAREFLLSSFGKADNGQRKFESHMVVAGYGADRPRKGTNGPMDPRNRRVEIRFSGKDQASFDRACREIETILEKMGQDGSK